MEIPLHVEIARSGTAAENVTQEVFFLNKDSKSRLLEVLLQQYPGSVLVFTRTKHGARKLAHHVQEMGHTAADIHSDRSLAQRRAALEGFKSGKYRVLVATDIAARGIDVTGIELVVNYDLPTNAEDYVHRIGRTGRAGRSGRAVSFATFDQRGEVRSIERVMRASLPVKNLPTLPPARFQSEPIRTEFQPASESRHQRSYQNPRGHGRPHGRSKFRGIRRGGKGRR
jgi:ATP-dependent RNA helicase RhlE